VERGWHRLIGTNALKYLLRVVSADKQPQGRPSRAEQACELEGRRRGASPELNWIVCSQLLKERNSRRGKKEPPGGNPQDSSTRAGKGGERKLIRHAALRGGTDTTSVYKREPRRGRRVKNCRRSKDL